MKRRILFLMTAGLAFAWSGFSCQAQEGDSPTKPEVEVLDEFRVEKVGNDLGRARHITVRENGDIYIRLREQRSGGGIVALRDQDKDGVFEIQEYFEDSSGTGIAIYNDYLYYSTSQEILRRKLQSDQLLPSSEEQLIVSGFPNQQQHAAKAFTIDGKGNLFVNVGAPSNACQKQTRTPGSPGMEPCPQLERQAGVWRFQADKLGQTQEKDGVHFATGLRNLVALDWNPVVNELYAVQHGRDQLHELFPDLYTAKESAQLPAEELFLIEEGFVGGWPYTYWDQMREERMVAPEYGGDGETKAPEGKYAKPLLAFPGHWAPNGLLFYTGDLFPQSYQGGAFIAFHGSWNRGPFEQEGYNVVFVPFEGSRPTSQWEVFAKGFAGDKKIESPGDAKHRPMGLAQGPQGELYVVDSVEGDLWRVTPK